MLDERIEIALKKYVEKELLTQEPWRSIFKIEDGKIFVIDKEGNKEHITNVENISEILIPDKKEDNYNLNSITICRKGTNWVINVFEDGKIIKELW